MALIPAGKWIDAIRPDDSVLEAARLSIQARLLTVAYHLPLAAYHAQYDVEHVHRLRVSTRRAMATLRLYGEFLPCKRTKRVKRQLKRVRRAAGEARDFDVLAYRLKKEYGEQAAPVMDVVVAARAASQPAIEHVAEQFRRKDRYNRAVAQLLADLDRPRTGGSMRSDTTDGGPADFRSWARRRLAAEAEKFVAALPHSPCDMAELHAFRIRAKALRYSIELLSAALDADIRDSNYRTIEELQERLGRVNDHAVARDRLRQWAEEASDPHLEDLLCTLAVAEVMRTTDEVADFAAWWTVDRAEQLRQGLSLAG